METSPTLEPNREKNPQDLSFQTIHDGLGFHPFEDGLPYAPSTKKRIAQESVTAAQNASAPGKAVLTNRLQRALQFDPSAGKKPPVLGRAQVNPTSVSQKLEGAPVPTPEPGTQKLDEVLRKIAAATGSPAPQEPALIFQQQVITPAPQVAQESPLQSAATDVTASPRIAPHTRLILAGLMDLSLHATLAVLTVGTLLWIEKTPRALMLETEVLALCTGFVLLFHWALTAAQEVAFGSTIGKRALGIELNGSAPRIFLRALLSLPCLAIAGLGCLARIPDRLSGVFPTIVE